MNVLSRFIKELPDNYVEDLTPSGFQSSNALNQSNFLEQEPSFYRSPGWSRLQNNIANKTEISIGLRNKSFVEVISGLEKGDTIVAEGLKKVRPKSKIKPIKN